MTICMYDVICVTSRALCSEDLTERIASVAAGKPSAVILREKDLSRDGYRELAVEVMEICRREGVRCILHSFSDIAAELGAQYLHMPLPLFRRMSADEKERFAVIGVSCHSAGEAKEAEALGCGYVTAGHVFRTDCKKGLEPRGTGFLREVCDAVSVPVYAIGGINTDNVKEAAAAGAAGVCVMSGLMRAEDPAGLIRKMELLQYPDGGEDDF